MVWGVGVWGGSLSVHPPTLAFGWYSQLVLLILTMANDILDIDVPQPSDAVRYHETTHQLGMVPRYSVGSQDTLVA